MMYVGFLPLHCTMRVRPKVLFVPFDILFIEFLLYLSHQLLLPKNTLHISSYVSSPPRCTNSELTIPQNFPKPNSVQRRSAPFWKNRRGWYSSRSVYVIFKPSGILPPCSCEEEVRTLNFHFLFSGQGLL